MVPAFALWRRAVAVVAAIVLSLLAIIALADVPASQGFIDFNIGRVREFRERHDPKPADTLRVVLLGNSRLKNATIDSQILEQTAVGRAHRRIESFRLVANWAVFENFVPLLDNVQALHADVYVIQMDLLVEEMAPPFQYQLVYSYMRWLTAGKGKWTWFDPPTEQLAPACTKETEPEGRAARALARLVVDPSAESPRLARAFIEDVTTRGAKVLLVSIPKAGRFEEIMPSVTPAMLAAAREVADLTPGVTVAAYSGILPDDHFCDVTHLNRAGGAAYSRWLAEQLSSIRLASDD
jgi:hypothetical protein